MGLEHYIVELLYRYNCVVVPEFGAFLTQLKSSTIHQTTNTFYPPSKTVSFNSQLTSNDGLLVSHMASIEKISYEEMLKKVIDAAEEWKLQLAAGERLRLTDIGELWLNDEGKTQFQPITKINYLTASFGLSSFTSTPVTREILKKEVAQLEEKIPFIITPEKREQTNSRSYLKYAAVILLAVSTGFTGLRLYNENKNNDQLAREEAQEQVSKQIQEATFFNTAPMELPAINLDVTSKTKAKSQKTHHIVAGAFRYKTNADKKIQQLKDLGYDAAYLGTNPFGLHMVTYDSFTDAEQALESLHQIKRTQSKDAWLLSVK